MADLRYEDLLDANLRGANLQGADLPGADLRYANLRDANLQGADLRDAKLWGANLRDAKLWGANLRDANLQGADLQGADLRDAKLWGANLQGAVLPHFLVLPEHGSFIAYKKVSGLFVLQIEIPADAKRTNSVGSRKCRASHVKVLKCLNNYEQQVFNGLHDGTEYKIGETVYADSFNDDIRTECTNGIHFFITLREAEAY
jgi:hypothetical protein